MRKFMILIAAVAAACLVAGPGHAKQVQVKLTSQQVTTTCGGYIVHTSSHYGCKKPCGDGRFADFHVTRAARIAAASWCKKQHQPEDQSPDRVRRSRVEF
jgi:hypothetical protein